MAQLRKPHPINAYLGFLKNYVEANTPIEAIRRDLITLHGYPRIRKSVTPLSAENVSKIPKSDCATKGIIDVDFLFPYGVDWIRNYWGRTK